MEMMLFVLHNSLLIKWPLLLTEHLEINADTPTVRQPNKNAERGSEGKISFSFEENHKKTYL